MGKLKVNESAARIFSCRRLSCKGFSLLELVVVLLIISISAGLFLGINFRQKESIELRSFASELSQFMRTARSHALLEGRDNLCRYHPDKGEVVQTLKGKSLSLPAGVELVFADDRGSDRVFAEFFADGSMVVDEFILRAGEHRMVPKADPFLGRVKFAMED